MILVLSLVMELRRAKERAVEYSIKARANVEKALPGGVVDDLGFIDDISEKLSDEFIYLLVPYFIHFYIMMWLFIYF